MFSAHQSRTQANIKRLGVFFAALGLSLPTTGFSATHFYQRSEVKAFISEMSARHGLDKQTLANQFSAIRSNEKVLRYIRPATKPGQRSWQRYLPRFVNEQRIQSGLAFWAQHEGTLKRAEQTYGVPAEIIVAIIGVETIYGRNMGDFKVLEALSTLAFDYPPRAEFFRSELQQFLLLAHENQENALEIKGSYAGAIGIPQFMPGSQRRYAVDFDGDGKVDLRSNPIDAIGSVAQFLNRHGWIKDSPIAVQVSIENDLPSDWLEAGIFPKLQVSELLKSNVSTRQALPANAPTKAALIDLITPDQPTEYWLGFDNFYVITRYNRSSFYAMSVFQLAEAIKARKPSA